MIEYIVICVLSLLGSGLTFFSGFGLGTILLPVFAIFFPVELAIALAAIVHFFTNLFKLALIGRHASKKTVFKFGIPAIISAFIGAYVLTYIAETEPLFGYSIGSYNFYITPLKLIIGLLLVIFALFDIQPKLIRVNLSEKYMPLGGLLSGFFGGLSGHQGALRTAFLIKANLTKENFIATGVSIAVLIDISRLTVYSTDILKVGNKLDYTLLISAILSAFIGAMIGNSLLKKITIESLQLTVGIVLLIFSTLLIFGIV